MVAPALFTPSRRQFPVGQLKVHDCASTSKNKKVQTVRSMRKRAFFMSCIWTSYQILHYNSTQEHTISRRKSIDKLPFSAGTTSTKSSSAKSTPAPSRTSSTKSSSASPSIISHTFEERYFSVGKFRQKEIENETHDSYQKSTSDSYNKKSDYPSEDSTEPP